MGKRKLWGKHEAFNPIRKHDDGIFGDSKPRHRTANEKQSGILDMGASGLRVERTYDKKNNATFKMGNEGARAPIQSKGL
jgi:hypothetical protein